MEWLAFLVGFACGALACAKPGTIAEVRALAIEPLAKLKRQEKRTPKVNDDRKAWARERDTIGGR
jgi:hypothetical protein